MQKTYLSERRKPSVKKPVFYLLLQLAMVLESALIIKGYFGIRFGITEILFMTAVGIYLVVRTIKVINRQQK